MRQAWVDAGAGVAGDMLLGALLDAGASLTAVQDAVESVLPQTVRLNMSEVRRAGMRATALSVELLVADQPHRRWADIRAMLRAAALPEPVRDLAEAAFAALAEAEARVHGVGVEDVHFHEVGGWDSIADVVGVAAAVHDLDVTRVSLLGPVALGSGSVRTAHGVMPVPVPAVLELSAGLPVSLDGEGESATPTGVALLRALGAEVGTRVVTPLTTGVGAGSRDTPGRANVVRVLLTESESAPAESGYASDSVLQVEASVDDADPRIWPSVIQSLLDAGALDAWLTPVLMKKGRPGQVVTALVPQDPATLFDAVREVLFRSTTTLGMRVFPVHRWTLERDWVPVSVHGHTVRVKVGYRPGPAVQILTATPEYEDAALAAAKTGLPVIEVLDAARARAAEQGIAPGFSFTPRGDH